jgi:hypothetical protein
MFPLCFGTKFIILVVIFCEKSEEQRKCIRKKTLIADTLLLKLTVVNDLFRKLITTIQTKSDLARKLGETM